MLRRFAWCCSCSRQAGRQACRQLGRLVGRQKAIRASVPGVIPIRVEHVFDELFWLACKLQTDTLSH